MRPEAEVLRAAMNVRPFAAKNDPPDRFLPTATQLTSAMPPAFCGVFQPFI